MNETPTAYDEIAYKAQVYPQTHPNRLAAIASLLGMTPAPPERCRTLEVGCGTGENLIALALGAPESRFVGFDLARGAIEHGQEMIRELGLANIQLLHADLMEFAPNEKFDYIVAHGFLSWVPPLVQRRLLEVYREWLAPQGVGYVSYNTFPGFHARRILRDMMRIHTAGITEPGRKIQQARGLVQFLLAGQIRDNGYSALLREEAEWILNRDSDSLLFHDDLADVNIPFWFREFASLASEHGLQYLAEADFFEMQEHAFPPAVVEALGQIGGNIIAKEQYLDFLKCRRFRQSLIVHEGVAINRTPRSRMVESMLIASAATPASDSVDLSPGIVETFRGRHGAAMQIDAPAVKAAMLEMQANWPRPISFVELVRAAEGRLGQSVGEEERAAIAEVLLAAYCSGMVELHAFRPDWCTEVSKTPVASPLLRLQILRGRDHVFSLRPLNFLLEDPLYQALLLLLDGTHDRAQLEILLREQIEARAVATTAECHITNLSAWIDESLKKAAKQALLLS
jgi:methyltransferase-like protein